MLFKHPLVWGIMGLVLLTLQIGLSYLSFHSFLKGDWLESILFFLAVIFIAMFMGYGYIWLRQRKKNL